MKTTVADVKRMGCQTKMVLLMPLEEEDVEI
jgi:hypothetical protein